MAAVLADAFGSIEALRSAGVEQIRQTPEIGEIIAQSVFDYLHSDYGRKTIDDLASSGVIMESTAARSTSRTLEGKTLVVTGTLTKYTRDGINELIQQHGGHAASSVSKNTDYVVAGQQAGSKLAEAQQLGVPVLTEEQFEKLINEG